MSELTPIAVVVDRKHAPEIGDAINLMGGAWVTSFRLWSRLRLPYLVMVADSPTRVRKRAPLIFMVADESLLRSSVKTACAQLIGKRCRWVLWLDPNSTGESIVREELLLDSTPQGAA